MDDLLDDFAGPKKDGGEPSRNSGGGAYSGFGILGKNSAMNKSGSNSNNFPTFGGKRNSNASAKEEEGDLLDNILDDFEEKKGIESTKPKKDSSFGSQNNQAFTKSGGG
jgi:hypothetical protein